MKLYVTYTSPYARLARILVIEKDFEDRIEIIEAKTRTTSSPYYQINPSGRVPYLVDDAGVGMEDSQLICAYLDNLDGKPRFHNPLGGPNWDYLRLEFMARSMCDGISVWTREISRPTSERSPTVLAHGTTLTRAPPSWSDSSIGNRAARNAYFFTAAIMTPVDYISRNFCGRILPI